MFLDRTPVDIQLTGVPCRHPNSNQSRSWPRSKPRYRILALTHASRLSLNVTFLISRSTDLDLNSISITISISIATFGNPWPLALTPGPRPYTRQLINWSIKASPSMTQQPTWIHQAQTPGGTSTDPSVGIDNKSILQGLQTLPYPVWVISSTRKGKIIQKLDTPLPEQTNEATKTSSMKTKMKAPPGSQLKPRSRHNTWV